MKKIVICVDENPINRSVCEYGLSVAKEKNCECILLYVIKNQDLPAGFFTLAAGGIAMYDQQILQINDTPSDEELSRANAVLNELGALCKDVKFERKIEFGNFIDILNLYAKEAEIFVMSIKDDENDAYINKSADVLISELKTPILFVNKCFLKPKSVLVAFDGLKASIKLLKRLKESGYFGNNLKFYVANVCDDEQKSHEILDVAREILHDKKAEFITLKGDPCNEIIKFRRANKIDFIATGALSKNMFLSLFLTSVSKNIMKNALVPILVLA